MPKREELERMITAAEDKLLRDYAHAREQSAHGTALRRQAVETLWQTANDVRSLESQFVAIERPDDWSIHVTISDQGKPDSVISNGTWKVEVDEKARIAMRVDVVDPLSNDELSAGERFEVFSETPAANEYLLSELVREVARLRLRRRGSV